MRIKIKDAVDKESEMFAYCNQVVNWLTNNTQATKQEAWNFAVRLYQVRQKPGFLDAAGIPAAEEKDKAEWTGGVCSHCGFRKGRIAGVSLKMRYCPMCGCEMEEE